MYEFDVIDLMTNKLIDVIFGYSKADALRRCPRYDNERYDLTAGVYID